MNIMEKIAISRLMRLINSLSLESKLEILSKLTENLKLDFKSKKSSKENLLDKLYGSWSDIDDKITKDIIDSRNNTNREISFE